MARRFFDPEGLLWKPLGTFGELLILSLLWTLCSLPLVTVGAATAALYDCVARCVRQKENDLFGRFFRTFKTELLGSIPSALLWAAVLGVLYFLLRQFAEAAGTGRGAYMAAIALLILLLVPIGAAGWVFPILSRFTMSFGTLNATAVKLALGNMGRTLLMGFTAAAAALLCAYMIVPLMFLPGLVMLLWSYLLEPVFRRYTKDEET